MIKVNNLVSGYGNKIILRNININFEKGSIYGLIGPNGSGKTTFLRAISGIIKIVSGDLFINDRSIKKMDFKEIAKMIAVVLPEERLVFDFKVIDIVNMGRAPYLKWNNFEDDNNDTDNILKETDLLLKKNDFYNELSSGERQLVEIARGLRQSPEYLLLDEPTAHLDIMHQLKIMSLIQTLNKNNNLTVIAVMHDINLASLFCDKLIIMKDGNIFSEGNTNEVINKDNIKHVFGVEVDIIEVNNKKQIVLKTPVI